MTQTCFTLDGRTIPFNPGQTIMDAALAAGVYIPHLCHRPGYQPHGSCKLCTVKVNGRNCSACTLPAAENQEVINESDEINDLRRSITQMLFVEGNHTCPGCEKSGNCQLQAVAYHLQLQGFHFPHFFPRREVDVSHPDVYLDRHRCILCELCVRASRDKDGKNVFDRGGRGINTQLVVNSMSGLLADSTLELSDEAVAVCPVGALLPKRQGFQVPIGERLYDRGGIDEVCLEQQGHSRNKNG